MTLQQDVIHEIHVFLNQNQHFFFNERDFQVHLAVWFKSRLKNVDVDVEYAVPQSVFSEMEVPSSMDKGVYPWENELKIDIVVSRYGEYCPIELKYKTKRPSNQKQDIRFGEKLNSSSLIKNQGAQDLGRYGFWKDVYRIELLKNRFDTTIKGGVCVFLTNDQSYKCERIKESSNAFGFNMKENIKIKGEMRWSNQEPAYKHNYPEFYLRQEYQIKWEQKDDYWYTIVCV